MLFRGEGVLKDQREQFRERMPSGTDKIIKAQMMDRNMRDEKRKIEKGKGEV